MRRGLLRATRHHVVLWVPRRLCHSDLFRLYGREPKPLVAAVGPAADGAASQGDFANPLPIRELERFDAEAYASGGIVSAQTRLVVLSALRHALLPPATRGTRSRSELWLEALRLVGLETPTEAPPSLAKEGNAPDVPLACLSECATSLLLSQHSECIVPLARRAGLLSGSAFPSVDRMDASEYRGLLRIASCYVVACCGATDNSTDITAAAGTAPTPAVFFERAAVQPLLSLIAGSRAVTASVPTKEDRRAVVAALTLLLVSLDLLWHERLGSGAISDATAPGAPALRPFFHKVREASPAWLRDGLFADADHEGSGGREPVRATSARGYGPRSISTKPLPAHLRTMTRRAAEKADLHELSRLYREACLREQADEDWAIFDLPQFVAERMLHVPGGALVPQAAAVVDHLGTSLLPATLANVGNSQAPGRAQQAVHWLSQMRGAEAYAALRTTLFHHLPSAMADVQLSHGDVLTGDGTATWATALALTHSLRETGQSAAWRKALPTTLRLLSDAGKLSDFFALVKEYEPGSYGGQGNLEVASALAQAMRRTGQWQHYHDVLELVASAAVPSTADADYFLEDACLQTIYALRNARRFRDAATFYGLLRPAMPEVALRVFSGLLSEVALDVDAGSDAEATVGELLRVAGLSLDDIPAEFTSAVNLYVRGEAALRNVDLRQLSAHTRHHAMRACVHCGAWRPLLRIAAESEAAKPAPLPAMQLWRATLKAMERGDHVGDETWHGVCAALPRDLWGDEKTLLQLFHTALSNGRIADFQRALGEHHSDYADPKCRHTAAELDAFISFLLHGRYRASDSAHVGLPAVRHSLVGHYLTSFLTSRACRVPVAASVLAGRKPGKLSVAKHFKVPPLCIGTRTKASDRGQRQGQGHRHTAEEAPSYHLRSYPLVEGIEPQGVLHVAPGLVVASKPAGAVVQSYARGVLAHLAATGHAVPGAYRLVYLLPPAAEGLFVLLSATRSPKHTSVDLTVRLTLIPASPEHVPLLSCKYFQAHHMALVGLADEDGHPRVTARCTGLTTHNGNSALRALKAALNEEGWTVAERDVATGDAYLVERAVVMDTMYHERVSIECPHREAHSP